MREPINLYNTSSSAPQFSTKQVARIAGVTTQTIYNWLKAGVIPEPPRDYRGHRIFQPEHVRLMLTHRGRILPPKGEDDTADEFGPL